MWFFFLILFGFVRTTLHVDLLLLRANARDCFGNIYIYIYIHILTVIINFANGFGVATGSPSEDFCILDPPTTGSEVRIHRRRAKCLDRGGRASPNCFFFMQIFAKEVFDPGGGEGLRPITILNKMNWFRTKREKIIDPGMAETRFSSIPSFTGLSVVN